MNRAPRGERTAASGVEVFDHTEHGLRLRIDSDLYPDEVVFRACYGLTGRCTILLEGMDANHVAALLKSHDPRTSLSSLAAEFATELINQRARAARARGP